MNIFRPLSTVAVMLSLVASLAHAQDSNFVVPDPLADLPPVGMALEVAKLCGAKASQFPELTKFKKLARESYVVLSQGNPADIDKAFGEGAEMARKLKPRLTPAQCAQALDTLKPMDAQFKSTNAVIERLMTLSQESGSAPVDAPAQPSAKKASPDSKAVAPTKKN